MWTAFRGQPKKMAALWLPDPLASSNFWKTCLRGQAVGCYSSPNVAKVTGSAEDLVMPAQVAGCSKGSQTPGDWRGDAGSGPSRVDVYLECALLYMQVLPQRCQVYSLVARKFIEKFGSLRSSLAFSPLKWTKERQKV